MLVYMCESDKEKIICNVDEKDIAEHLRIRLKKEQEEKEQKRKERVEAHLYTIIMVARDEDLHEHIGNDIFFDLVDHDKVQSFRIKKQVPFILFKVVSERGIHGDRELWSAIEDLERLLADQRRQLVEIRTMTAYGGPVDILIDSPPAPTPLLSFSQSPANGFPIAL